MLLVGGGGGGASGARHGGVAGHVTFGNFSCLPPKSLFTVNVGRGGKGAIEKRDDTVEGIESGESSQVEFDEGRYFSLTGVKMHWGAEVEIILREFPNGKTTKAITTKLLRKLWIIS